MPAGRPKGTFKNSHPARVNGKVTKTYSAWQSMIARCSGKHPASRYYSGRIKVCPEWIGENGYENFLRCVGVAPDGMWLDRINNDGDYEPGNVRWTKPSESAKNRRQGGSKNSQPMSLRSICAVLNVPYQRTYQRIKQHNWTFVEAFHEKMPPKTTQDAF